MNGETLIIAFGGLAVLLLSMLMTTGGTNVPGSLRFTSMVAGAKNTNPDYTGMTSGPGCLPDGALKERKDG